jgi:hypothetical protein
MALILGGMFAVEALFCLLLYVVSERDGIPGIIVATVVFIVAAVFVITIAGRFARRRIRARYACRPARAAGS